jgi:hypothetical protein
VGAQVLRHQVEVSSLVLEFNWPVWVILNMMCSNKNKLSNRQLYRKLTNCKITKAHLMWILNNQKMKFIKYLPCKQRKMLSNQDTFPEDIDP